MLKFGKSFGNVAAVEKGISQSTRLIERHENTGTAPMPVFLATDFADYGTSSKRIANLSRYNTKSMMNILAPLKPPVIFQPSAYNLTAIHGGNDYSGVWRAFVCSWRRFFSRVASWSGS